jgi:hypothetical protein
MERHAQKAQNLKFPTLEDGHFNVIIQIPKLHSYANEKKNY